MAEASFSSTSARSLHFVGVAAELWVWQQNWGRHTFATTIFACFFSLEESEPGFLTVKGLILLIEVVYFPERRRDMDPMEGCSHHFDDLGCKVSEEELPTEDLLGLERRALPHLPWDSPMGKLILEVLRGN